MAAIQSHKPVDHETTTVYRKTTTMETGYNKANNERSFGNKMKEMANSATKLFHHGQNEHQANNLLNKQHPETAGYKAQQTDGTGISSNTTHATNNMQQPKKKKENLMSSCTGKKKKQEKVTYFGTAGKKEEKDGAGGVGGYLATVGEHVKHLAHKVDGGTGKKKKSKGHGGATSSGSDSSSDEGENDRRNKKK